MQSDPAPSVIQIIRFSGAPSPLDLCRDPGIRCRHALWPAADDTDPDDPEADLVIVDFADAHPDLGVVEQLSRAPGRTGLIILGGGTTEARIDCMERGADDCLMRPFHSRELSARVRAILRGRALGRRSALQAPRDRIGKWRLDAARRRLRSDDGLVRHLTATEACLLDIFLQHPDVALSREDLEAALTACRQVPYALRSLDAYINRLRDKLGGHPQALIETIRGKGYRFVPEDE